MLRPSGMKCACKTRAGLGGGLLCASPWSATRRGRPIVRQVGLSITTRQQLTDAIESLDMGLVMYDAQQHFVLNNQRYLKMFTGENLQLVLGESLDTALRQQDKQHPTLLDDTALAAWNALHCCPSNTAARHDRSARAGSRATATQRLLVAGSLCIPTSPQSSTRSRRYAQAGRAYRRFLKTRQWVFSWPTLRAKFLFTSWSTSKSPARLRVAITTDWARCTARITRGLAVVGRSMC